MRIRKLVGSVLTYIPHLIGKLFAACVSNPAVNIRLVVTTNLILFPESAMLHSAGCSLNIIVDADLEKQVERTRFRPIPHGAIKPRAVVMFTVVETLVWLVLLRMVKEALVA